MSQKLKTMTLTQVASAIGKSKKTVYNMIKDKRFPIEPIKGTNPRLWNACDVEEWVKTK